MHHRESEIEMLDLRH